MADDSELWDRLVSILRGKVILDAKAAAVRVGELKKEGKKVRSWKRRFFVLSDGLLLYYRSEAGWAGGEKPLGGMVLVDCQLSRSGEALTLRAGRSCTLGKEESRGRVFLLKGAEEELQAWERALADVLENEALSRAGSRGVLAESPDAVSPPPFLPSQMLPPVSPSSGSHTGLSLSAQRSIHENEFYKTLNLEKIGRLLFLEDILLVIDWISLDSVDNIGFIVYNQILGMLADSVARCSLLARQNMANLWQKPVIRFNILSGPDDTESIDILDGEMIIGFRIGHEKQVGAICLETKFGPNAPQPQ